MWISLPICEASIVAAEREDSPMPETIFHDDGRRQALDRTRSAIRAYARRPCAMTEVAVETAVGQLKRAAAQPPAAIEVRPKSSRL